LAPSKYLLDCFDADMITWEVTLLTALKVSAVQSGGSYLITNKKQTLDDGTKQKLEQNMA
jgi:hypothetical protein